jgi:hypothetical protein
MRGQTIDAIIIVTRKIAHAGALNFDNPRTKIRELTSTEWGSNCMLQRKYRDAIEWTHKLLPGGMAAK